MKKQLRISDTISLPLNWMLQATVVYGARGSGKTVFGADLAEEVDKAGQRFCAIDLKGDFYGLKSSADGKSAAVPAIVFGGDHADVPLEPDAGAFIGETVAGLEQSCILDLEHLSKGKQVRFLTAFFASLYDHNRAPIMLLLDECQRYAPQKPIDPDAAKCLGAVEDLVKLGRKHGIGTVLITQRGSGLNKEVSELCELLVAFRTPGPLDQERVRGWLLANTTKELCASVMPKLPSLPTGTAVFASGHPDLKVGGVHRVRMRETFDSSSTPKIGERRKEPKKLAQADLTALQERMAAAIERAKADDPKELRRQRDADRKRIAELERDLERAQEAKAAAKPAKQLKPPKEVAVIRDRDVAALERVLERTQKPLEQAAELVKQLERAAAVLNEATQRARTPALIIGQIDPGVRRLTTKEALEEAKTYPPGARAALERAARVHSVPMVIHKVGEGAGDAAVGKGQLRQMLIALAQRPAGLTSAQIGVRAGCSTKSSTFGLCLAKARKLGWIRDQGPLRFITSDGVEALGAYEPLPIGRALLEYWVSDLGDSAASRMLATIARAYPEALTNAEIATQAEVSLSSSTYGLARAKLSKLELITKADGGFRASDELFDDDQNDDQKKGRSKHG